MSADTTAAMNDPVMKRSANSFVNLRPPNVRTLPEVNQPANAAKVFPKAITRERPNAPLMVGKPFPMKVKKLARKAPVKMPTNARGPRMIKAPNAIPAGGQIGLALVFSKAKSRAIRAMQKYSSAVKARAIGNLSQSPNGLFDFPSQ